MKNMKIKLLEGELRWLNTPGASNNSGSIARGFVLLIFTSLSCALSLFLSIESSLSSFPDILAFATNTLPLFAPFSNAVDLLCLCGK